MPMTRLPHLLLATALAAPLLVQAQAAPKAAPAAAPQGRVAGLEPDRRPTGAPVIRDAQVSPERLAYRLHGVDQPVPQDVMQMARQGSNWYSPFFRPGMPGPYDLRHWHHAAP